MFYIGQKVVCVDVSGPGIFYNQPLIKNEIYTIIAIGKCARHEGPGILVAKIEQEYGYMFKQSRFRPLVEKKTDISIFTAMLNKNKELV